ncbi:hypothetical protein Q9L58_010979, partial [Maublancomyces gigas]
LHSRQNRPDAGRQDPLVLAQVLHAQRGVRQAHPLGDPGRQLGGWDQERVVEWSSEHGCVGQRAVDRRERPGRKPEPEPAGVGGCARDCRVRGGCGACCSQRGHGRWRRVRRRCDRRGGRARDGADLQPE